MNHEILINHQIELNKYLIGISCNYCDAAIYDFYTGQKLEHPTNKYLRLIKKVIKNHNYQNIPIYVRNAPMPRPFTIIK